MKKVLLFLCCLSLVCVGAQGAYQGTYKLKWAKLPSDPTIDGAGNDAAWVGQPWVVFNDALDFAFTPPDRTDPPTTTADNSGRMKVGWRGTMMYMLVEVTDDQINFSNSTVFWRDCIEFYFDLNNQFKSSDLLSPAGTWTNWDTTGGPTNFRVLVQGDPFTPNFMTNQFRAGEDAHAHDNLNTYVCAVTGTNPTYEIALHVTSAALTAGGDSGAVDLGDKGVFAFCINITDADGGFRKSMCFWWGGVPQAVGTYNSPAIHATPWAGDNGTTQGSYSMNVFVPAGQGGLVPISGGEGESEGEGEGELTLSIVASPGPGFIEEDGPLSLTAPPGGLSYEWHFNDAPMSDTDRITGTHSRVLRFNPVLKEDEGTYTCVYDDGSVKVLVETPPFELTVLDAGSLPIAAAVGAIVLAALCGLGGTALLRRRR